MRALASLAIGLMVFTAGVVYTLTQPRTYEARGVLQWAPEERSENTMGGDPNLRTWLEILKSNMMANSVFERLSKEEQERLVASDSRYVLAEGSQMLSDEKFARFSQMGRTAMVEVAYRHRDAELAAIIVNAHMREFLDLELKRTIDRRIAGVENLRERLEAVNGDIELLEMELADLREYALNPSQDQKARMAELGKELDAKIEIFEAMSKRMTTEMIVFQSNPGPIIILEEAKSPERHISPNMPLQVALSLFAGILGGASSCFVIRGLV